MFVQLHAGWYLIFSTILHLLNHRFNNLHLRYLYCNNGQVKLLLHHKDEPRTRFRMKLLRRYKGPMMRQITDSVHIETSQADLKRLSWSWGRRRGLKCGRDICSLLQQVQTKGRKGPMDTRVRWEAKSGVLILGRHFSYVKLNSKPCFNSNTFWFGHFFLT